MSQSWRAQLLTVRVRKWLSDLVTITDLPGVFNDVVTGNRSVVLYNMSEYENCLSDIRAALHFGYPENLQYKVYERQGRCHQALG